MKPKSRISIGVFDPKFNFLLELDPRLEGWRVWAAEYWTTFSPGRAKVHHQTALVTFLVQYMHGLGLHHLPPTEFFADDRPLPEHDAIRLIGRPEQWATRRHDLVSDFLDWVLREKLAEVQPDGHRVVPAGLANPFPRRRVKQDRKQTDLNFDYVLRIDSRLDDWRQLAAEWNQTKNFCNRRKALDFFLVKYIHGLDLERNYGRFLLRETEKPNFIEVLVAGKTKGHRGRSREDVKYNNVLAEFLDWVLTTKLGDEETGAWDTSRFHNPIKRLRTSGIEVPTETNKPSLSIRYIKELREMLAEGPHFRDWTWAQGAMKQGTSGGDWFVMDQTRVDPDDPDCVFRERDATAYEIKNKGYSLRVLEMWSPVRAVGLYLKLELPLRTHQVRMLDSGEADTYRFVYGPDGGGFVPNHSPLASGDEKRPYQRGVFHRSAHETGAGLYVNTNKTADIDKAESARGYVIPWAHDVVLYWLEKLRNWQERYNPIQAPTPWSDLEPKHFGGTSPHTAVLAERGDVCFLFRDPTDAGGDKPLRNVLLTRFWYLLLSRLEKQCAARGEGLGDGTPLRFVDPESNIRTLFPPHALRVSLISYLILDLKLPMAVVSKLIAGHATILMTLYYTKFGVSTMREVLAEAEKNTLEADRGNHRRFLMDATFEQIGERFASLSLDAARAASENMSAAAFVFEDKGICPVGGVMCDCGGEPIRDVLQDKIFAPVPGYPQERNCVRCRFFLTGPAFLPGLQAHFNTISEKMHRQNERYFRLESSVTELQNRRRECARDNQPFVEVKELERLSQRLEAETQTVGKLLNDMQATYYLIERSIKIAKQGDENGVKLVAKGGISDLQVGLIETNSELHQLEVVCENAVIYPETDAAYPVMRRSQILDAMFQYNEMGPVFMHLTPEHQLLAGNAVMKLIQARTGSIEGALPYAECRRKLTDLGVIGEEIRNEIAQVTGSAPIRDLIEHAQARRKLKPAMKE